MTSKTHPQDFLAAMAAGMAGGQPRPDMGPVPEPNSNRKPGARWSSS